MASHIFSQGSAMKAVAIFEVKNRFSEMISAVEHGEEITITRHGSPVARLVAISTKGPRPRGQRQQVLGAMEALRTLGGGGVLGASLEQAIQEGRD
jgi:prevent-host-death family protein